MILKINEMILESGIKKKYIAKKLELDPNTLSRYISGERRIPLETAVELADLLQCKITDLYIKK